MANTFNVKDWLSSARNHWGLLAQCAVWVVSAIGSFVLSPPADIATDDNQIYIYLAKFVVAVLVGLVLIIAAKLHRRKYAIGWAAAAVLLLVMALMSFDIYQQRLNAWTCHYDGQRKIVGADYTQQGRSYVSDNPGTSCDDLIFDFAGKTEDIWTKDSIDIRRLRLSRLYLLCITLFALCLLGVIQALYCTTGRQNVSGLTQASGSGAGAVR